MKILIVCRELPPVGGGAGYVALKLALHLDHRGHEVDVVTMDYGSATGAASTGSVDVHRVKADRKREDSVTLKEMVHFTWSARKTVTTLVSERGYDVLHAHAIVPDGLVLPSRKLGARTIVTAHGSDVPGYNPDKYHFAHKMIRPLWKRALRYPDVVTVPSEHLASLLLKSGKPSHIKVVPNGIETSLFQPEPKQPDFLVVSRLVPRKNTHLLLCALRSVEKPTRIHIVGDGPERHRLERLASELEHHNISFYGWLEHGSEAWRRLYQQCRFFVFLSNSENFPINLLEAQLARMVVVASDIPGNREVLGSAARYVKDLSVKGVEKAITEVQNTPESELEAEATAAERRVLDNFSWERVTDRFVEIYRGRE